MSYVHKNLRIYVSGKRKHDIIGQCYMYESPWPENLDWNPPLRKLKNGTIIAVVEEPDDSTSQVSDRTRCKGHWVERTSSASHIGTQTDSLDRVLPSTNGPEAQRQALREFCNVSQAYCRQS